MEMDFSQFANDEEDAKQRAEAFKHVDPFPDIPPALLNTADTEDYIRATALLHPYTPYSQPKYASISLKVGNRFIYWKGDGSVVDTRVEEDAKFDLPENSIVFVETQQTIRLPDYLAMRFNLHITQVHRGLLLGTGPLVDPGFEGKLLIPLHNLTTNRYPLRAGEDLIWAEFTKLSPITYTQPPSPTTHSPTRNAKLEAHPHKNSGLTMEDYLHKALTDRQTKAIIDKTIRSSIPDALNDAQSSAKSAKESAENIQKYTTWGGLGAGITLAISLIVLAFQVVSMMHDSSATIAALNDKYSSALLRIEQLEQKIASLAPEEKTAEKMNGAQQNGLAEEPHTTSDPKSNVPDVGNSNQDNVKAPAEAPIESETSSAQSDKGTPPTQQHSNASAPQQEEK